MKLVFLGATREVTGSCTYLEACGKKLLIDCGMEQGPDEFENRDIPVEPSEIDYVLLTHAHIDHSGRIPLLYAHGFRGEVFATGATCDLCDIMLRDSAHIQEFEAEWRNRKGKRAGKDEYTPMYTMEDAVGSLALFRARPYGEKFSLCDSISLRFTDCGHLLGSAAIEIWIDEDGVSRKLVFSGDIGNANQPLIRDPSPISSADYVIMESTYGDRSHVETPDCVSVLSQIINETFARGGNVVIPSFAVGRTQELLYFIRQIKAESLVAGDFPVYVDSPLAIEATHIFNENRLECFDERAMELIRSGVNPISFDGLITAVSSDDSKAINFDERPKVIISASGMCEAGRIKHHLKHNLWRPECTVLFVGYQAAGTLGRSILEGANKVKLFGEEINIKAKIMQMHGVSAHADKDGLIRWLSSFSPKPAGVFIIHGEDSVCASFAGLIQSQYGCDAYAPCCNWTFDLAAGEWVAKPAAVPSSRKAVRARAAFERLKSAGKRLAALISNSQGRPNKDITKLADQIESLCNKWEKLE